MKVLVVVSFSGQPGGRELALAERISREGHEVVFSPKVKTAVEVVQYALGEGVKLAVVGPEAPLGEGVADLLRLAKILTIGAGWQAAQIELNKAYAKELMSDFGIETPAFAIATSYKEALAQIHARRRGPLVVKASGSASGKGAIVCRNKREARKAVRRIMVDKEFGDAGNTVVIEDFVAGGEERSYMVLTNAQGEMGKIIGRARDFKRVRDGDKGPNGGGSASLSPVPGPYPEDELDDRIMKEIVNPLLRGMKERGTPYRSAFLYVQVMIVRHKDGVHIYVIEFNCRLGDPETQVVLPRIKGNFTAGLWASTTEGDLTFTHWDPEISTEAYACLAAYTRDYGFVAKPKTGHWVKGIPEALKASARGASYVVFLAGVAFKHGRYVTSSGRVLYVIGRGQEGSIYEAIKYAEDGMKFISFKGMKVRRDIAKIATAMN